MRAEACRHPEYGQEISVGAHVDGSITLFQRCMKCKDIVGAESHESEEPTFDASFTVGAYTFRIIATRFDWIPDEERVL